MILGGLVAADVVIWVFVLAIYTVCCVHMICI